MSDGDVDFEEIPGVPGRLPPGEFVVWQGRPRWRSVARHTFKARWVAGWLALFTLLRLGADLEAGAGLASTAVALTLSLVCLGILAAAAVAYARSTIYTLTSRRIIMRIGVAVPMSINVPFKVIASADLRRRDDCGDVVLRLSGDDRIAWLNLWPHVAWGNVARPSPTLLGLAEPEQVAATLRETVARWAEGEGRRLATTQTTAPAPAVDPAPTNAVSA
ncbi:MAG: PH domain-containing protein [Myxococcaceae bacterium]|nr:PH domain-containing protein [Myxococcaceae bacterium]